MSTPDIMAERIAELEEQVADQARWIAGLAEGLELASKARRRE